MRIDVTLNNRLDSEQYYVETMGFGRRDIVHAIAYDGPKHEYKGAAFFEDGKVNFQNTKGDKQIEAALEKAVKEATSLWYYEQHQQFFKTLAEKHKFPGPAWQF